MPKTYYNPTTLHDLLMNTLLGFVLLFTVAILLINPDAHKADIETKAEYVITLTWSSDLVSDVDIWVEDPLGNILFFRDKEKGLMHLDRDDLGNDNDYVFVNGVMVTNENNQEIVSIRGFIPGEWVINLHLYMNKDGEGVEIPVRVKITKLNPKVVDVFNKKITLKTEKEEVTVTRFVMDSQGDIIEWWNEYKNLIRMEGATPQPVNGPSTAPNPIGDTPTSSPGSP